MSYFKRIRQDVIADADNSTTSDIASGEIWNATGSGTSTLGIAGIQVNVHMDQNAYIYVDQSTDRTNWDITDTFNYYTTDGGMSWTIQATASYVRVRVQNLASVTSGNTRIQTALCPIVEALPRSLDSDGNLKTGIKSITGQFGTKVKIGPTGSLKSAPSTRLVGSIFNGTTLDSNFWSEVQTSGGAVSLANGEATLSTNTTANAGVLLNSQRTARYVAGMSNYYRAVVRLPVVTTSVGENTRRFGAFDANDGYFFECVQNSGQVISSLNLVCRKSGADTNHIHDGSFNGEQGGSYTLNNNVHTYEIYWTNSKSFFFIDDDLIHTFTGSTATLSDTPSLKIGSQCVNSGGNTANNTLVVRVSSINRFGDLLTQPMVKYQSGTTAGVITKIGAGNIHSMIVSSPVSGSIITLYDGTTTGGTIFFSGTMTIGAQANNLPITIDFKGAPFSTGLFLVVATQNANVTLIYE